MENEIKTNESQQAQALGLLNAKDVVVSVVKVTAEGVSIKLWPDADAERIGQRHDALTDFNLIGRQQLFAV